MSRAATFETLETRNKKNVREVLKAGGAVGLGALTLWGAAAVKPETSEARLGSVGPALSSNKHRANRQLDWMLDKTGPDQTMAKQLGKAFRIKTSQGRHKYITPENIDLGRRVRATNKRFPYNTGVSGSTPVRTKNHHPVSSAYTVVAGKAGSRAEAVSHAFSGGKLELSLEVMRRLCENMLGKKRAPQGGSRPRRQRVGNNMNIDVSYGIKNDLKALSKSSSSSNSGAQVVCPDGTTVKANSSAYSSALAEASSQVRSKGEVVIKSRGSSFTNVQSKYEQALSARASTATSSVTSSELFVNCGKNNTPPPPPPHPKPKYPPAVDVVGWQHIKTGDVQQACAYETDADNNITFRNMSETGNGEFISPLEPGDEKGEYCRYYRAGTTADTASITYSVRDADNQTASDTETFPVDDSELGQF